MVEILLEAGMDPNCFDGTSGTDILFVLVLVGKCHIRAKATWFGSQYGSVKEKVTITNSTCWQVKFTHT